MTKNKGILWFRNDLRLHDNEALMDALEACDEILPVYVFDDRMFEDKTSYGFSKTGTTRKRFIIESVRALDRELRKRNSRLQIFIGKTEDIIYELARKHKTKWVFCNRERTRDEVVIQDAVEHLMWSIGQEIRYSRGKMLLYTADLPFPITHTPDLFTTFRKEVAYIQIRQPLAAPPSIPTLDISDWTADFPEIELDQGEEVEREIEGGEESGLRRLHSIHDSDQLSKLDSGMELSPWISQGCLSPKSIYYQLKSVETRQNQSFISDQILKLVRRDYFRCMGKKFGNLIFVPSGIQGEPVSRKRDMEVIDSWCSGQTGQPLVDAGIRALVQTGFIDYKMRVLLSSYFIHELNQDWVVGAEFFESNLIDYDPCSNYGNWNRLAGVGAVKREQAKLNFDHQSKMLDPDGEFVAKWGGVRM
jgi:deoxyribodipyrimidine photo-lyase